MSWHVLPQERAAFTLTHLPELPGVPAVRARVKGRPITLVRHDLPTWLKLRGHGLVLPSPAQHAAFPGRFAPRAHQLATIEHLLEHRKAFVLNGLGTGKTLSAIWAADYLMRHGLVRRVLVVAPLSICHHVWERELFQTVKSKAAVLHGDRRRKQQLAADTRIPWLVVNPESLHFLGDHLPEVDLVIVDEFTKFKNARSRRWRALRDIARDRRLWLMSGTPAPQSPMDAYGPVKLINPKPVTALRWRDMTMRQLTQFRWEPRDEAPDVIARWMQPAVRFRREDCYDMPDVSMEEVEVDLTPEQSRVVKHLQKEARALVAEQEVTAANAAGVLGKVLQTLCGFVYTGQGQATLDAASFYEAIEEVVEQADTPVLVFSPFRASVAAITAHLKKAGYRVGTVTGDTKSSERGPLFDQVQKGTLDALVAVAGTMSHGLTLTTSRYVLWTSPPFSFEEYEQANGRVIRDGQRNNVVIYQIIQNRLARSLFRRLESKARLQDVVLDLIAHFAKGDSDGES